MNLKVDGSPAAVMHRGFFNPNSTITAKFKQSVKDISITKHSYYYAGGVEDKTEVEYKVSSGVALYILYSQRIRGDRENGDSYDYTTSLEMKENEKAETAFFFDDGYGNSEQKTSTLTKFVIKVNGKEIYNAGSTPTDGSIHNGYRIKYSVQTHNM